MLQDQVRNLQSTLDAEGRRHAGLVQQTLDSVNRTNTAVAVMENSFNDAMKQQQQSLNGPVANVGQKLDQMSEDFRAVRESVLDMNTRMGKLDAKMADLQNLINTHAHAAVLRRLRYAGNHPGRRHPSRRPPQRLRPVLLQACRRKPPTPTPIVTIPAGKYDLAMQEFSDYLKYFPNTEFDSNAQYLSSADIYYQKQDYDNAVSRPSTQCWNNIPTTPRPPTRTT